MSGKHLWCAIPTAIHVFCVSSLAFSYWLLVNIVAIDIFN